MKNCFAQRVFVLCSLLIAAGCNGPTVNLQPNYGPVTASQSSIALTSVGSTATTTLSEANGAGSFSTSGCSGVASTALSGSTLTVTAIGAGTCSLIVSGQGNGTATIAVVVTTSAVTGS